jgi:hypothetical protein
MPAWHPLWLLMTVRASQLALSSDDETSNNCCLQTPRPSYTGLTRMSTGVASWGAARLRVGHDGRHPESQAGNDDGRVVTVTGRPPE